MFVSIKGVWYIVVASPLVGGVKKWK